MFIWPSRYYFYNHLVHGQQGSAVKTLRPPNWGLNRSVGVPNAIITVRMQFNMHSPSVVRYSVLHSNFTFLRSLYISYARSYTCYLISFGLVAYRWLVIIATSKDANPDFEITQAYFFSVSVIVSLTQSGSA
jgi:hypothetical protein